MPRKAETTVSPTESKAIREGDIDLSMLGLVRGIVAIEPVRQPIQIDRRRHDVLAQLALSPQTRKDRSNNLHRE